MSYKEHVDFCYKRRELINNKFDIDLLTRLEIKKCAKCGDWLGWKNLCTMCDDAYHDKCDSFVSKCAKCRIEFKLSDNVECDDEDDNVNNMDFRILFDGPGKEDNKEKLLQIFKEKGVLFSDDLVYNDNRQFNKSDLIQKLGGNDVKVFEKLKSFTRFGYYFGMELHKYEKKGWGVRACIDIKDNTLLGEYAGDVIGFRDILNNKENNYYFTLVNEHDSYKNLVVDGEKRSNLMRFINSSSAKTKANCSSLLVVIEGEVRILIFTVCDIGVGEEFVYDYNGGLSKDYNTDNFE